MIASVKDSSASPTSSTNPRVAIVLVHYGDPEVTWGCVRSLETHEPSIHSIIIVDHGPGPALIDHIPKDVTHCRLRFARLNNPGFGAGCNRGAELAFSSGADLVWFLNNDARLGHSLLEDLLPLVKLFPKVGMWGTHQRDGVRRHGADRLPKWYPTPCSSSATIPNLPQGCRQLAARETLSGASILVSKAGWDRIGPWPEWCFLYYEDVAWCLQAHELGIPIVITGLEISHARNTTTGHHSPTTTYYGVRNSLLLHADRWPNRKVTRFFQSIHFLQKRLFQGNFRMLGPTFRGVVDAWRNVRSART